MIILLLFAAGSVSAQKKKSIIHLIHFDTSHGTKKNGIDLLVLYKAVFQQDNSILSSDSAYFYTQRNAFDAFGHVIITQGDTLHVYADKLNYDGNTKTAILTDNVRMIDRDAILTTNYLVYNTGTRIGTYTGGGKLVNKDNVLTSKNGYYFASSRDAYFRYNVVLTTPDAIITTDTLRYNSGTRITYFYGPTNINGKQDKDVLYTENGTYNTQSEQAFFGKKNLYTQGTKTLKGDSLFYDRARGYGRAVNHVVFNDTEQKTTIKGGLGEYFKAEERTLVTKYPYVVLVTEQQDTTKKETVTKAAKPVVKKPGLTPPPHTMPVKDTTLLAKKDTAISKPAKTPAKTNVVGAKPNGKKVTVAATKNGKTNKLSDSTRVSLVKPDSLKNIKRDSLFMTADTIETQILTYKALKELKEKRRLASIIDTTIKVIPGIVYTKPVKFIEMEPAPQMPPDISFLHPEAFKKIPPVDTTHIQIKPAVKVQNKVTAVADTSHSKTKPAAGAIIKKPGKNQLNIKGVTTVDSVYLTQKITLSDTARIRILSAAHKAKIYKSDLQARADSIFYSYSDSTMRMYVHPMIWAEGSQLSGDTINLQMKNKKVDNIEQYPSAFIVNIEKGDSSHFNQVGGRKMIGFFKAGKIDRIFVDGNAETIYYVRDSLKNITNIDRSISSRIRVNFKNGAAVGTTWYGKPEHRTGAPAIFKEDEKLLKGFIWKPKDRPVSKESIIPSEATIAAATKKAAKAPAKKVVKGDVKSTLKTDVPKPITDSLKVKADTLQHPAIKADSLKSIKTKTDSTKHK